MVLKWVVPLFLLLETGLAQWRPSDSNHFRLYLEDDQTLFVPKRLQEVKILHPVAYGDKLYDQPPKSTKKPLKYVKLKPIELAEVGKKCCGSKWALDDKDFSLEDLIRPVSLPAYRPQHGLREYETFDDVKPVTEIIEDDIKYDFRTRTHSLR